MMLSERDREIEQLIERELGVLIERKRKKRQPSPRCAHCGRIIRRTKLGPITLILTRTEGLAVVTPDNARTTYFFCNPECKGRWTEHAVQLEQMADLVRQTRSHEMMRQAIPNFDAIFGAHLPREDSS